MGNLFRAEGKKLRHSRILLLLSAWILVFPVLIGGTDILQSAGPEDPLLWLESTWLIINGLMLPMISGFALTYLIQKEYMDGTLTGCLTAPLSRGRYLWGKLMIWGAWHMTIVAALLVLESCGFLLLYGVGPLLDYGPRFTGVTVFGGAMSLLVTLPVAVPAVLQRKSIYPALVAAMLLAAVGVGSVYWTPLWSGAIPWSAATYWGQAWFQAISPGALPYISIALCATAALALAHYCFARQEL